MFNQRRWYKLVHCPLGWNSKSYNIAAPELIDKLVFQNLPMYGFVHIIQYAAEQKIMSMEGI